jgi:outer membrane murein-binding lipoprotein Lpp
MNKWRACWKEIAIGTASLVLAGAIGFVVNGAFNVGKKVTQLPDPPNIATVDVVDQKVKPLSDKIDALASKLDQHAQETKQKIDDVNSRVDKIYNLLVVIAHKK